MKVAAQDIILAPVITENSMAGMQNKKYTFKVAVSATKVDIARACEELFGVKVAKVNTINYDGKAKRLGAGRPGRRKSWKKAYVQLAPDSKTIEMFEGMV